MKVFVARDKDGSLHLYTGDKLYCENGKWYDDPSTGGEYVCEIDRRLFSELKFEDGPKEITYV